MATAPEDKPRKGGFVQKTKAVITATEIIREIKQRRLIESDPRFEITSSRECQRVFKTCTTRSDMFSGDISSDEIIMEKTASRVRRQRE